MENCLEEKKTLTEILSKKLLYLDQDTETIVFGSTDNLSDF